MKLSVRPYKSEHQIHIAHKLYITCSCIHSYHIKLSKHTGMRQMQEKQPCKAFMCLTQNSEKLNNYT